MKKRIFSLFLCAVMLFGMFPTILSVAADEEDITVHTVVDGQDQTINAILVPVNTHKVISAHLGKADDGAAYQWQIRIGEDTWINIQGATAAELTVNYGLVHDVINGDGQAFLRCVCTGSDGSNFTTEDITVQLDSGDSPATMDLKPTEFVKPKILKEGSVVIHYQTEGPAGTTDEEKTTAENTDNTTKTDENTSNSAENTTNNTENEQNDENNNDNNENNSQDNENNEDNTKNNENENTDIAPQNLTDDKNSGNGGEDGISLASFLDLFALEASADVTDGVKKTYSIVINYTLENGTPVSDSYTATLAEGSAFSATVTFPVVQGYLPYVDDVQKDSIELNYTSISENVTINVVYKSTNVNYTVIHYKQNVDNDQYTIESTETKQGLTASQVPEVAKTFDGFYSLLYERPAIAADGSTVIEVYYDRYYYLMNFDMDGGYGTDPVYARYGAPIGAVKSPTKAGYTFDGWSETEGGTTAVTLPTTMPAESKTYYAIWQVDSTAKVTVVFWGENADDEGYSYLADATKVINLKPGKEFTYSEDKMLVCDKEVHTHTDGCIGCGMTAHTHSALDGSCYTLNSSKCSHTQHTISCYSVDNKTFYTTSLVETSKPSQTLTDAGNGIFTYKSWGTTYYYLQIGDKWYCGHTKGSISGNEEDDASLKITFQCSHTHTAECYDLICDQTEHSHTSTCYTCGKEEHSHIDNCYMQGAGLDSNLWKFVKSDTITVAADGSSVVNVYYDRTEKTLTFKYSYSRNSYQKTETITAKWGQNIATEYNAIVKNAGSTFWSADSNYTGPYTNYFGVMPTASKTYYYKSDNGSSGTMKYYGEDLNGNYVEMFSVSNVGGYTVTVEDHYEFKGFTYDHGTENGKSCSGAAFYYKRNSYNLTFNDQYTDVKKESVKYEAPLSTYKDYVPEVPSAFEPGSVEFGGWYLNPQCTGEEYKLDEHTMDANDLILYAKWVPVTHTVKFYLTEKSESIYKPETADDEASFTVSHGDNIAEEYVKNHLEKSAMNTAKPNGDYSFVMWYYYDDGVKTPFDPTTQIRKDLTLYGEWSSNTLKPYTVQYVLKSDHSVKIADDLTGSGLAGTTKTFDAKGGTELYAAYQEGYFPTVQSQSLLLDIDSDSLVITFEYVPMPAVPYTVKYVEKDTGNSLADDKVVSDNRKAVVTETFKPISGYMPDAYQKRLVVTADGENILYFYYTKDETHAYYKITHYTQNTDGENWTEYASSQAIGDIGTRYTSSPMTIPGFTYQKIKYVVNGKEVTDVTDKGAVLTADGLEINLYYVRNDYPYQVRYLEQGSGNQLAAPKDSTGKYGQIISESAIDIDGYDKVDPTSATLNIRIDEGEGAPKLNIITFYYKEQEVTINYVAVGPKDATNFGSVDPTTETVKVTSGVANGSTPTAGDGFKFVGWFKDEACTEDVDTSWVTDNKLVPQKTDGKNVAATYYAKFEYDVADLTITKTGWNSADLNQTFIFKVTSPNGYSNTVVILGNGSVTIKDLEIGTYTVTEDTSWSWRYDPIGETSQSKTLQPGVQNVVTFANKRTDNKWLDNNAYADNNFSN